ncbi:hypothetical protein B0G84_3299 [Paraburkholderia sp. BL8N3]|nr:hypothetical protein [Paraburkholderia sp. BL8N3]TCK37997.1 hypothetical protein B0G84_3299 [Paraburkholderia sp. BL8N3]
MARIRTIKPDFWSDEKIVELEPLARLFFIGSWNFADDRGNLPYSCAKLKMQILPADLADVALIVGSLIAQGLLTEYSVKGHRYLHINGFAKHQRINRPSSPDYPTPEEADKTAALTERSNKLSEHQEIGRASSSKRMQERADKSAALTEHSGTGARPLPPAAQAFDEGEKGAALTEHSLAERKGKEVNLKPKTLKPKTPLSDRRQQDTSRARVSDAVSSSSSEIDAIEGVLRQAGVTHLADAHAAIEQAAHAGATQQAFVDACATAMTQKCGKSFPAAYVVGIVANRMTERREPRVANGHGPAGLDSIAKDRKRVNALTRSSRQGEVIDIPMKEIRDDTKRP